MWMLMGGFLVTAIGATAIGLVIDPEPAAGNLNEWVILGAIVLVVAGALGGLRNRWFTQIPQDAATGVSTGVILRVAVAEMVWLLGFVFFILGLMSAVGLLVALLAAVVLALLFAAPTGRLIERLQEQLNGLGAAIDLESELRSPIQR